MQYLIEMVIAVGVAFAISFILYKDQAPQAAAAGSGNAHAEIPASTAQDGTEKTASAETKEEIGKEILGSPVNGKRRSAF